MTTPEEIEAREISVLSGVSVLPDFMQDFALRLMAAKVEAQEKALREFLVETVGGVDAALAFHEQGWEVLSEEDVDFTDSGRVNFSFKFKWVPPREED